MSSKSWDIVTLAIEELYSASMLDFKNFSHELFTKIIRVREYAKTKNI